MKFGEGRTKKGWFVPRLNISDMIAWMPSMHYNTSINLLESLEVLQDNMSGYRERRRRGVWSTAPTYLPHLFIFSGTKGTWSSCM
jgi:hypothetical protein